MFINEVEYIVKLSKKSIRYYEELGLINPKRNVNNDYRVYDENDINKLKIIKLLRELEPNCKITVSSHFPEQDVEFNLPADEIVGRDLNGTTNEEIYKPTIDKITPETVCISAGGDNYCYNNWERYALIHKKAIEKGAKSILWSCSLEPSMIDEKMLEVLKTHHLITARESFTENALLEKGLKNVVRVADIAFLLEPKETLIPKGKYIQSVTV